MVHRDATINHRGANSLSDGRVRLESRTTRSRSCSIPTSRVDCHHDPIAEHRRPRAPWSGRTVERAVVLGVRAHVVVPMDDGCHAINRPQRLCDRCHCHQVRAVGFESSVARWRSRAGRDAVGAWR